MATYSYFSTNDTYLLREYEIGTIRKVMGIHDGLDNSNFLIITDRYPYILTIFENRLASDEWMFFLKLQQHLLAKNFPCAEPIYTKNDELITVIKNKPAAIFTYIHGKKIDIPNVAQCKEIGRYLARLHLFTKDFALFRSNDASLSKWTNLYDYTKKEMDNIELGLSSLIKEALSKVVNSWPADLPNGVIHGDLFPDNALFFGDKLNGIIDFYFACNDFYIYDLALTINSWCFDDQNNFDYQKANAIFNSYHNIRPILPQELEIFSVVASGAALKILISRISNWLNPVEGSFSYVKKPNSYTKILKHHLNIKSFTDYEINIS